MTNDNQYDRRPEPRQPSGRFAGIMRVMFLRQPWIAPLILAAMTLLVWGAINALPAREPEVRIRVVQETVEVTVYVTRLVTATPLPTVTRTPTPVRTRTPQQEIDRYAYHVIEVNGWTTVGLDTLVKRLDDPDEGSSTWRRDIGVQAQLIRDASTSMAAIEPPPEAVYVHGLWVDGTHDYVLAVDELETYLDHHNRADLDRSVEHMTSGLDKITRAADILDGMMSH